MIRTILAALILVIGCQSITASVPVTPTVYHHIEQDTFKNIYEHNIGHTVKVHINCVDICGSGSGMVFRSFKKPGEFFLLTNAHVVEDDDIAVDNLYVEFDDGS
jgi:hypothetical protein